MVKECFTRSSSTATVSAFQEWVSNKQRPDERMADYLAKYAELYNRVGFTIDKDNKVSMDHLKNLILLSGVRSSSTPLNRIRFFR